MYWEKISGPNEIVQFTPNLNKLDHLIFNISDEPYRDQYWARALIKYMGECG